MNSDQVPSDVVRSLFFHMSTYEQTRRSFDHVLAELKSANDREQQLQAFLQSDRTANVQWMTDQLQDAEYVDGQMKMWFQTLQTTIAANDALIKQRPDLILGNPDLRKISILQALTNKITQLRVCPVCSNNPCTCQYSVTRATHVTPSAANTFSMTNAPSADYTNWNGSVNTREAVLTSCPTMPGWNKIQALSVWGVRSTEWRSLTSDWSISMRIRFETGDWYAGLVESSGSLSVEKIARIYLHYDSGLFDPNNALFDSDIVNSLNTTPTAVVGDRFGMFIRDATGTHITFDAAHHPFLWQSETEPAVTSALSKYVRKEVILAVDYKDDSKQTTLSWTDARSNQLLFSENTTQAFHDWEGSYMPVCFALNRCEMYVSSIRIDERQIQPPSFQSVDVNGSTCTPGGAHLGETAGCIGHTLF
jgi:hypothetical protein